MAKDPILPLYYNDITRSTSTWTDEEFGAYLRLLIEQWDKGFIPKDYQRLTRLATSLDTTWCILKDKFAETDSGLQNINMEEIRSKRKRFKDKQKDNVLKRYQKSTKPYTKNIPLEIEIENENEIKEKNTWVEKFEKFIDWFNEKRNSRFTTKDKKTKDQFIARMKEGYSFDDFDAALSAMIKDPFHIENNFKYVTPEFLTRAGKLEQFSNMGNK